MPTVPQARPGAMPAIERSYLLMARAHLQRGEQLRDGQLAAAVKNATLPEPKITKAVTARRPDLPAMRGVLSEDKPPAPSKPTDRGPVSPLGGVAK
jgi:hypothetical protein